MDDLNIEVHPSSGIKCPRCWHYHHVKDNYDGLCDRCCTVMVDNYPNHELTRHIVESLENQLAKWNFPRGKWLERWEKSKNAVHLTTA